MSKIHDNFNYQLDDITSTIEKKYFYKGNSFTNKSNYIFIKFNIVDNKLLINTTDEYLKNVEIVKINPNSTFSVAVKNNEYMIIHQHDSITNKSYFYDQKGILMYSINNMENKLKVSDEFNFTLFNNIVTIKTITNNVLSYYLLDNNSLLINVKDVLSNVIVDNASFTFDFDIGKLNLSPGDYLDLLVTPIHNPTIFIHSTLLSIENIDPFYIGDYKTTIIKNDNIYTLTTENNKIGKIINNNDNDILFFNTSKKNVFAYILYDNINDMSYFYNIENKLINSKKSFGLITNWVVDISINKVLFFNGDSKIAILESIIDNFLIKKLSSITNNISDVLTTVTNNPNEINSIIIDEDGYPDPFEFSNNILTTKAPLTINNKSITVDNYLNINTEKLNAFVYFDSTNEPFINYNIIPNETVEDINLNIQPISRLSFDNELEDISGNIWFIDPVINQIRIDSLIETSPFSVNKLSLSFLDKNSTIRSTFDDMLGSIGVSSNNPCHSNMWTFDLYFYFSEINTNYNIIRVENSGGYGLRVTNDKIFISSNGTSDNIANGLALPSLPLINTWNYLNISFNGNEYSLTINNDNKKIISDQNITKSSQIVLCYNFKGYLDNYMYTPFYRDNVQKKQNIYEQAFTGKTFASLFNSESNFINNNLKDEYGFYWNSPNIIIDNTKFNKINKSLLFNETNFICTSTFPNLFLNESWTIEFDFNILSSVNNGILFSTSPAISERGIKILANGSNLNVSMSSNNLSYNIFNNDSIPIDLNTWNHLAIVYNFDVGYTIYKNGLVVLNSTIVDRCVTSNYAHIGSKGLSKIVFNMCEFRFTPYNIYKTVFTAPSNKLLKNVYRDVFVKKINRTISQGMNNEIIIDRKYMCNVNIDKRLTIRSREGYGRINILLKKNEIEPAFKINKFEITKNGRIKDIKKSYKLSEDDKYCKAAILGVLNHDDEICFIGKNIYSKYQLGVLGIPNNMMTNITPRFNRKTKIVRFAIGSSSTIAASEDNCIYMWGLNDRGQLGLPIEIIETPPLFVYKSNSRIKKVYTGGPLNPVNTDYRNSMFINDDGEFFVTGDNKLGILGQGNYDSLYGFVKIPGVWENFHCSGISIFLWEKVTGKLFSCGLNGSGHLGNYSSTIDNYINVFQPCYNLLNRQIDNVKSLIVGIEDSVSTTLVLCNDNKLYGCGYNGNNSLCYSSNSYTPFIGPIATDVKDFYCGFKDDGGIIIQKTNGDLYCCGPSFKNTTVGLNITRLYPLYYKKGPTIINVNKLICNVLIGYNNFIGIQDDGKVISGGEINIVKNCLGKSDQFSNGIDYIDLYNYKIVDGFVNLTFFSNESSAYSCLITSSGDLLVAGDKFNLSEDNYNYKKILN